MCDALKCDCAERVGVKVNSMALFRELDAFFRTQVEWGIFMEEPVGRPYYTWRGPGRRVTYYADKRYRCKACGCLWEVICPDFPAQGRVRKFPDGTYYPESG